MELLVVRHAQPERARPADGPADPPLSDLGREQAAALADWLAKAAGPVPGRIVSSSMRRARETAEAVSKRLGVPVEIEPRIAEFDLGAPEYVPLEQVGGSILDQAIAALKTGRWGTHTFVPEEFQARVQAGFDEILRDASSQRVVVVCHGGVLNSWLSHVLKREHGVFFMPHYTSVNRVVVTTTGELRVGSLNELPHAPKLPIAQHA